MGFYSSLFLVDHKHLCVRLVYISQVNAFYICFCWPLLIHMHAFPSFFSLSIPRQWVSTRWLLSWMNIVSRSCSNVVKHYLIRDFRGGLVTYSHTPFLGWRKRLGSLEGLANPHRIWWVRASLLGVPVTAVAQCTASPIQRIPNYGKVIFYIPTLFIHILQKPVW